MADKYMSGPVSATKGRLLSPVIDKRLYKPVLNIPMHLRATTKKSMAVTLNHSRGGCCSIGTGYVKPANPPGCSDNKSCIITYLPYPPLPPSPAGEATAVVDRIMQAEGDMCSNSPVCRSIDTDVTSMFNKWTAMAEWLGLLVLEPEGCIFQSYSTADVPLNKAPIPKSISGNVANTLLEN